MAQVASWKNAAQRGVKKAATKRRGRCVEGVADLKPVEYRMLNLLDDGQPHTFGELLGLANDPEYGAVYTMQQVLVQLRKKIAPHGRAIYCIIGKGRVRRYLQVRNLHKITCACK